MCLYVTSVKLSGSQAKVNSPALGSGVMGAKMFFLRNPGTPGGFWLGPVRSRGGKTIPSVAPHKNTHWPVSLLYSLSLDLHLLFCPFVSLLLIVPSLWFFPFPHLCTQNSSTASLSHIYSDSSVRSHTFFLPKSFQCWHKEICMCPIYIQCAVHGRC